MINEMINEMKKNSGLITQGELNESVQGKVKRHIRKLEDGKKQVNKMLQNMNKMLSDDLKSGRLEITEKDLPILVNDMHRPLITVEKGIERLIKRLRKLEIDASSVKTKEDKAKILSKFKNETAKDRTLNVLLKLMKDNKNALRKTNIFAFLVGFSAVMMISSFMVPGLVGLIAVTGLVGVKQQSLKSYVTAQDFNMFMQIISDFPIVALKNFFVTIKEVKTTEEGERLATKLEKHLDSLSS